jgi:hypothetical protein
MRSDAPTGPMPRPSSFFALALAAALLAAGCAAPRTAPRVVFLADGVFKSPTTQDAEAYCRNFGAPMRYLDPEAAARAPGAEVSYRCD